MNLNPQFIKNAAVLIQVMPCNNHKQSGKTLNDRIAGNIEIQEQRLVMAVIKTTHELR